METNLNSFSRLVSDFETFKGITLKATFIVWCCLISLVVWVRFFGVVLRLLGVVETSYTEMEYRLVLLFLLL